MDVLEYVCEPAPKKLKINEDFHRDVLNPFLEVLEEEDQKGYESSGDEEVLESSSDYNTQQIPNSQYVESDHKSKYGYKKLNTQASNKKIETQYKIYTAFEIMKKTVSNQN